MSQTDLFPLSFYEESVVRLLRKTNQDKPATPVHLGEANTEQFTVTTRLNGEQIGFQKIHDPFIHSVTKIRGFRYAWSALFGGLKIEVGVNGTQGAQRAIMTLNPIALQQETEQILEERGKRRESQSELDYRCDRFAVTKQ